jgi:dolichol-phosphate mannosyltransferase
MSYKIIIGIPVYNEELGLTLLLEKLLKLRSLLSQSVQIVLINDGSTDGTEEILLKYANAYSFFAYINHDRNLGLGKAINTLFLISCISFDGNDVLVTLDGDNTHNPKIIPQLVGKLKENGLDLVIASRFAKGGREEGLSMARKIYSRGAKFFFKSFFPIDHVNDYSSGFRCYSIEYLRSAIDQYDGNLVTSEGFDCMAEIIAKFSVIGVKADEFPLVLEYHLKQTKSKMRILRTIRGYFSLLKKVRRAETAIVRKRV